MYIEPRSHIALTIPYSTNNGNTRSTQSPKLPRHIYNAAPPQRCGIPPEIIRPIHTREHPVTRNWSAQKFTKLLIPIRRLEHSQLFGEPRTMALGTLTRRDGCVEPQRKLDNNIGAAPEQI